MNGPVHAVLDQIADARAGQLEWSDIRMGLLLQATDDEGIELEKDEFEAIIRANEEFTIGRDRYELVHSDNGEATYRCGQWSALMFRWSPDDKIVWVTEAHPY